MATITVKELSEELDTTPRTARKFLRHITPSDEQPGKGGRWQIEKRALRGLKKQFATYTEEHMRDTPADQVDADSTVEVEELETETE